jgi:transposase
MGKSIYKAVSVNAVNVEKLAAATEGRLVLGCDAAKEKWFGVWMNEQREVLRTMSWDMVDDFSDVMELLQLLRKDGIDVQVAIEPTGTYADATVWQLREHGFEVFRVSSKHVHDYQEIYDGVPSGHDAKSAAIVAKLHLDRGAASRCWEPMSESRRELRVAVDQLDWIKQEEQRSSNRLESRLARHWPEFTRVLNLDTVTAVELLAEYGGPATVAADSGAVPRLMHNWSKGNLSAAKIKRLVASAVNTLGVPMLDAEREQVQQLAVKLRDLRRQRKEAEADVNQQTEQQPQLKPICKMVGVTTAGVLHARLGDLRDYSSVRALLRAPGLNLREQSSGKKKGQLTITKRGSSVARRWLYLAALRWIKADPVARAWFESKKKRNGNAGVKAVVALTRKLLAALYHIVRGNTYDATKLFDCKRLQLAA